MERQKRFHKQFLSFFRARVIIKHSVPIQDKGKQRFHFPDTFCFAFVKMIIQICQETEKSQTAEPVRCPCTFRNIRKCPQRCSRMSRTCHLCLQSCFYLTQNLFQTFFIIKNRLGQDLPDQIHCLWCIPI